MKNAMGVELTPAESELVACYERLATTLTGERLIVTRWADHEGDDTSSPCSEVEQR